VIPKTIVKAPMLMRVVMASCLVAGLAMGASACGSSVDGPPGSGGEGGEGASSTGQTTGTGTGTSSVDTGTTSGTGTATSTSTGSTNPGGCAGACGHLQALGCEGIDPSCQQECEATANTSGGCAKVFDDVLGCVAVAPTCDIEEYCDAQFDAFAQCIRTNGCGPAECSGGATSGGQEECACNAVCSGQEVEAACSSNAGGQAACTCYVNGQVVAECTEPTSTFCDLEVGCCAQFF